MIKVEQIDTWGIEHAIRGMRNHMNSWHKSDSFKDETDIAYYFRIGSNDLALMKKLIKSGHSHRKFLRQIFVSMDITAPLYWWKQFDTYKVGTVANSCSTIHMIHEKEFTIDDFSHEHLYDDVRKDSFLNIIDCLNFFRALYLQNKDKADRWQIIQLLPSSYNQKRTVTFNYENALNMIEQREGHEFDEWREFVQVLIDLPYMKQIIDKEALKNG